MSAHCKIFRIAIVALLTLSACGGDKGLNIPGGGSGGGSGDDGDDNPGNCSGTSFTFEGEVLVDPNNCLAWSPISSGLTWHQAVSASEATSGGCTTHCDSDTANDHCAQLDAIDGFTGWTLPTIDELEELAINDPPWTDLSGDLWSRDSSDYENSLAWTLDLTQPGMNVLLDKGSSANARCVADAQ